MLLAAMLRAVSVQHTTQCLSFHESLHPFLRMSIPAPLLSLSLWLVQQAVLPLCFLAILIHIPTTTPFYFCRPVDLMSFHPLLPLSVLCHLQHQAVVSVWHLEGGGQSACQKSYSSNHRHGRLTRPSRNGQLQVREKRNMSRK